MPLSLAKLVANTATAEIDFGGGDVLHVAFHPTKITGKMLASFVSLDGLDGQTPEQQVATVMSVTDALLALLTSWDLTGEDGVTPLPIDRPTLDGIGLSIQWQILMGVLTAGAGKGGSATEAATPGEAPAPAAVA